MLWKPYDARFDEFKRNMSVHKNILQFVLSLHHIKITKQAVHAEQLHFKEKGIRDMIHDDRARRTQTFTEEIKDILDLQQRGMIALAHLYRPAHLLFLIRPSFPSPPTMDTSPRL